MTLTIELLGHWPKHFAKGGKRSADLFNSHGRPKAIGKLEMWPLDAVLREKYDMAPDEAQAFCDFLLPMLRILPRERATAAEMLTHPWLSRVLAPADPIRHTASGGRASDAGRQQDADASAEEEDGEDARDGAHADDDHNQSVED